MKRVVAAVALGLCAAEAGAQEVTLGRGGDATVLVWRDGDAMSEGFALIRANVHKTKPELVMRLLSCIAEPGDKAVIVDSGFATHTILITNGPRAGCRGDVAMEEVNR